MTKDNFNNTCSCGSGKEYKECCGVSNVVGINPELYNDDLDNLHQNLAGYAMDNFQDAFIEQSELSGYTLSDDDDQADQTYLNGITLWMILNVPIFEGVKTIFDIFFQQQKPQIKRTRTKNIFATWGKSLPSVYEVISIDQSDEEKALVKDVLTEQEFITPIEENSFQVGSLVIGILVPYVGYHRFFFSMLEIYDHAKESVLQLQQDFLNEDQQLAENFPAFLLAVLEIDEQLSWDLPIHEEVVALFTNHLKEKDIPEEMVIIGVLIWYEFCKKNQPNIKNSTSHAAGLEYFFHTYILENSDVTQKQLADEYGTTSGAISTNYRKILTSVEEDMVDEPLEQLEVIHDVQTENKKAKKPVNDTASREEAQKILAEAKLTNGKKRQKLIEQAIAIYPNHPDAYLLLAEEAPDDDIFRVLLLQAIQAGEEDLGKAFFVKHKGHFYELTETRPYMRALALYTNFLFGIGESEEALKHAEELLLLNPLDHQGIRYVLLPLYIEFGKLKQARTLINTYDERSTNFIFNRILVEYLMSGLTPLVKKRVKRANKQNRFVKGFLQGKKEITDYDHAEIKLGNEVEAMIYADSHFHIWQKYPELLKSL